MPKILKIILGIVLLLIVAAAAFAFLTNQARNTAEQQGRDMNPIFHTVPEGGTCRPDMGDCQVGLTCNQGICAKP